MNANAKPARFSITGFRQSGDTLVATTNTGADAYLSVEDRPAGVKAFICRTAELDSARPFLTMNGEIGDDYS